MTLPTFLSKLCRVCNKRKSRKDDFHKDSASPDGYRDICKSCKSLQMKEYYKRDPKARIASTSEWRIRSRKNKELNLK